MVRLRDSWPFSLSSAPTVGNPCRPLQPESVSVRSFPRAWAEAMTLEMPRDFTLERILGRLGGGQDGARLKKIEHAEAVHRRAHHDLGPVKLELRLDDRALHDLESSEHRLEAAGRARRMRAWAAGHVDGDEQVGAADQVVER